MKKKNAGTAFFPQIKMGPPPQKKNSDPPQKRKTPLPKRKNLTHPKKEKHGKKNGKPLEKRNPPKETKDKSNKKNRRKKISQKTEKNRRKKNNLKKKQTTSLPPKKRRLKAYPLTPVSSGLLALLVWQFRALRRIPRVLWSVPVKRRAPFFGAFQRIRGQRRKNLVFF